MRTAVPRIVSAVADFILGYFHILPDGRKAIAPFLQTSEEKKLYEIRR
jgi:hypothetical protein